MKCLCCVLVALLASTNHAIDVSSKLDFDTESKNSTVLDSSLSPGIVNAFINLQQNIQTSNRTDALTDELIEFGKVSLANNNNDATPAKLICVNNKCLQGGLRTNPDPLVTDLRVTVLANVNGPQKPTPSVSKDVPVFVGTSDQKGFDPVVYQPKPHHHRKEFTPYPYHYNQADNEFRVPHFEPSFHTHYFGENPPPQSAWINPNVVPNPKEFVYVRPARPQRLCACPPDDGPHYGDSQFRDSRVSAAWTSRISSKIDGID